jgi:hypothetical protein
MLRVKQGITVRSFETSGTTHETSQCHVPEDLNYKIINLQDHSDNSLKLASD